MANLLLATFSFLIFLCAIGVSSSTLSQRKVTISDELDARLSATSPSPTPPTTFFEVRRPIPLPKGPLCSTLVLQHDFASTLGKPPITSTYSPPPNCPLLSNCTPSGIVLEWSAACAGRQFDRIFGVWLAGVELFRSCTAEPRATGIVWSVRKDVTRYASLFSKPQILAVYLGNIVDKTYTGVYHVNVTFYFYFNPPRLPAAVPAYTSPADLIIPISKSLPLNGALWFQIQNSTDVQGKKVEIPRNAYRAVLEVSVSFHSDDEFWYTNPPNSYISDNNLTSVPGNGAFREVAVRLDGTVVGAIWPFTVIYTGGLNPLLWRPISAIGSFDLPSYDIEITPFLGTILDGENHFFGFGVTDSLNVWFIDANLHVWIDKNSSFTEGGLVEYEAPPFAPTLSSRFKDLDGFFDTTATRTISCTGWVTSSYGKITTSFLQKMNFTNKMIFSGNGSNQEVNHSVGYHHGIYARSPSSFLHAQNVWQRFPLYLYSGTEGQDNGSYSAVTNITLGYSEERISGTNSFVYSSFLWNSETGHGVMRVKEGLVTGGAAGTQQDYNYGGSDGCYVRKVASNNYTILYDESRDHCK